MLVSKWLKNSTDKLSQAGIGSAALDTQILLEDLLHKDRSWLLAHGKFELTRTQLDRLDKQLARRVTHEPLAYIRGFTEFYGRKFKVNKRVLEPRPESEAMIDLLKTLFRHNSPISEERPLKPLKLKASRLAVEGSGLKIADVGTGSGCLGITAALELHNPNVDLFDIDANALAVAKHNCELHELRLRVQKRDLLRNAHTHYDVILANLPYVPTHFHINEAAAREPRLAIFGGSDGLDVYRRLFEQLGHFTWRPRYILTEALPPQHEQLKSIAKTAGFQQLIAQDFVQVFEKLT